MKKLTVLVDMDSVIADFYFGILDAYEKETGLKAPVDCLNTWDAKLPNGKDCFSYFGQPGFFRGLKPIPGALEFIRERKEAGDDVLIVSTATITHGPGEKFEWLSEHLPDFERGQVIFAKRKDRVIGDVLIDDHAANTGPFRAAQPNALTIGIEYPYNIDSREAFSHLVPGYQNFPQAWSRIRTLVAAHAEANKFF